MYQVCYTRYYVSFYLWLIGSVLKHCKVPKYYEQDCRSLAIAPTIKYIVPSKFLVALIATGTSTLKVVGILVALKAKVTEEERWGSHRKRKC